MPFNFVKKSAALASLVLFSSAFAELPLGIIGGQDSTGSDHAYAALVSSSGSTTSINIPTTINFISKVAINTSGQGLIGGGGFGFPTYAALVSPSGTPTPLSGLPASGEIGAVAINEAGLGLIGGLGQSPAYAAFVSTSGALTPITTGLPPNSTLLDAALNNSGKGVIVGRNFSTGAPYAALVSSPSPSASPLTGLSTKAVLESASINDSGQGILGGRDFTTGGGYAVLISSSSTTATSITGLPIPGAIFDSAINNAGQGIIGGQANFPAGPAYAAFVSPSGTLTPINLGIANGLIRTVAINSSGQTIVGGQITPSTGAAYAAFVSPSGTVIPINTNLPSGDIFSVAINDFGQAIIGGQNGSEAYAAIVSPSGIVTPLNLGFPGAIFGVGLLPLLTHIPTVGLSGNSLSFANYINENAPQNAFYFVPALLDGTLSQALESAAPTRNAISQYTASHNLFYLTTSLSNHLRNRSMWTQMRNQPSSSEVAVNWQSPDQLQASCCIEKPKDPCAEGPTNSVWFEAIGALAYQKAQHQTPGFHPTSGAAILAYDGKTSEHTRAGMGAAYMYTHIKQNKHAGHNNIKQEDLFVYGSWENKNFYVDGSLLGGLFQIHQARNIKMTGFSFKSKSHVHGWQLLPHLELGYHYTRPCGIHFTVNPFVMVDWANAWQHSYKEKGSGPFNAGQKSHYSSLLRTEASIRFYETVFFNCWNLIFQEKVGYVNVHSFKAGRMNAFLVGSPGSFTVSTLTSDQNLGVGEFAMTFAPQKLGYPTTTLFYQGEFGSKYQSHQVALELAWDF